MAIGYWTFAGVTFSLLLKAFLKDTKADKLDSKAWLFILVATLLWPITLPFIIRSKLKSAAQSSLVQTGVSRLSPSILSSDS